VAASEPLQISLTDPEAPGHLFGGAPTADHRALFASLYAELHRIARREVNRQGPGSPCSPTTLLHETFLNMSERDRLAFPDRSRFLSYAGRVMRGLVIDRVRERHAQKRGGDYTITDLDTQTAEDCIDPAPLTQLSEALDELAALEPELATVVDLKYFCGFNIAEVAELQGLSQRSVQRRWEKAKLLLQRALAGGATP
jgi:RNA polymerase sigma factor (TIGR02999 family)